MKKKSKLDIAIEKGRKTHPDNTFKACICAIQNMDKDAFKELRKEAEKKWKDFGENVDFPKASEAKKK